MRTPGCAEFLPACAGRLALGRTPSVEYHTAHDEEDWSVTLVETGLKTMTGGRLARVLPHVRGEDFLLTYGDGLTDSDINASIAFHQKHGGEDEMLNRLWDAGEAPWKIW